MTREFADGQIVPGTRYRVIGHLGSGGMGSVYLVEHTELGKQFVLKALFKDLASRRDLVARLRQEWRALGRLDHPNIVAVTDAGTTDDNQPYYVMERVEGETLAAVLDREQAISVPRAIQIAAAVLDALSAAHEIGIVHRDVKPPNIFVAGGGSVKLLDFGVAKLADSSAEVITARGVAIGTPRYMSPEQAKGKSVDARADLYAVGLVLYECIAGVGPFDEANDANELLLFQLSKEPPRLSNFHRGVKPELDDIVASLLAKDPAARPGSAQQVAQALRALVKRRSLPPTRGATPDAGYDAVTGGAESVVMPSTKPDGVAGRRTPSQAPTVDAVATPGSTTVIIGDTTQNASQLAPDTEQATTAGLDWAKDGFDTLAADAVPATLGNTSTWVSPPPSGVAPSSGPRSDDRTQPIEEGSPLPPNEVETRTSVPAAPASVTTLSGETPPPVHADSVPAPTRGRTSSGPLVVALVVAALLGVVAFGLFAARSLRQAALSGDVASAPAPIETLPAASAVLATPPPEPGPSASGAPAAAPEPSAQPAALKPATPKPVPPAAHAARPHPPAAHAAPTAPATAKPASSRPLPASGL